MQLKTDFKKDISNSYMIINYFSIKENDLNEENISYSIKMILNNDIEKLLHMELRIIDEENYYYYDINEKQKLVEICENNLINGDMLENIIKSLFKCIDNIKNYLLSENDLILELDKIFLDENQDVYFCFIPAYSKDIREQLCDLLEQLMKKINHKDKKAVMLVYNMYKVAKDKNSSFSKIKLVLEQKFEEEINLKKEIEKEDDSLKEQHIPLVEEKINCEKEVEFFSIDTYIKAIIPMLIFIILTWFCFTNGYFNKNVGVGYDFIKLSTFIVILIAVELYICKNLFSPNNKKTKIINKVEYVDNNKILCKNKKTNNVISNEDKFLKNDRIDKVNINKDNIENINNIKNIDNFQTQEEQTQILNDNEYETQILNYNYEKNELILKSEDIRFNDIKLNEFPFIIGKLKNSNEIINDKTISRFHAKIDKVDNRYFLTDLNSTNGTYLNGQKLESNIKNEINVNDEISFAFIKYKFI